MHSSTPLALCDFLAQVRQPHIGAVALNQILFSVLSSTPAFAARQANDLTGILAKL